MSELSPATRPTKSWFPKLSIGEWATFAVLAAVLALTNIYSTLLSGWGDGGSIIAVVASVLVLGVFMRKKLEVVSLNLGQTMVSAGGTVGFSVTGYAAIVMVDPGFSPDPPTMIALFVGMGMIGTVIGSSVRKQMVRYYFPSGTACAVIQKTVSRLGPDATEDAKKPVFLLALWGSIASLITVPVKITLQKGGHAILSDLALGVKGVALTFDPLFYGIGIVVGPRVGLGMIIGGLASPFLIGEILSSRGMEAATYDWVIWIAIAVLTLPTFATIYFAYRLRTKAEVPGGFEPGKVTYAAPAQRNPIFAGMTAIGITITMITGYMVFDIPPYVAILVIALSWPMCIMNGRVTGETDINPVRLVNIVILSVFVFLVMDNDNAAVILIGMAIVGGTLAGMAVDMMQDYRTGYLLNANHNHQTSVQFLGVVIGAVVSVPFILLLADRIGFGKGSALPAPGPQIYSRMATTLTEQGSSLTTGLIVCVAIVSVLGCLYAYATVHPKTNRYMPSIFGIGIGLLLPVSASLGIFLGGMIKWGAARVYQRGASTKEDKAEAASRAGNDTMLAGSSIFAASALVSVMLILIIELLARFDLHPFYLAGH